MPFKHLPTFPDLPTFFTDGTAQGMIPNTAINGQFSLDVVNVNVMTMLEDAKHIKKEHVNIFAGNIKVGLRKAYGIRKYNDRASHNDTRDYSYSNVASVNLKQNGAYRSADVNGNRNTKLKQMAGYNKPQLQEKPGNNILIHQAIEALKLLLS